MNAAEERQKRVALASKCGWLCLVAGALQLCYSVVYFVHGDQVDAIILVLLSGDRSYRFSSTQFFTLNVVLIGLYLSVAAFASAALCLCRRRIFRTGLIICMGLGTWLAFQHATHSMSAVGLPYILFVVPWGMLLSADYAIDSNAKSSGRRTSPAD